MATVTDSDLKEIKDLLTAGFTRIDGELTVGFNRVDTELTDIKISIARIEATMQAQQPNIQKIPDLAEKVGELKNWKQTAILAVTAATSGAIGWLLHR